MKLAVAFCKVASVASNKTCEHATKPQINVQTCKPVKTVKSQNSEIRSQALHARDVEIGRGGAKKCTEDNDRQRQDSEIQDYRLLILLHNAHAFWVEGWRMS